MVFGSDAGVMPHGQIGKQFRTMVDYGMTPLQAIQAATRNSAEALGRADVGTLAPGRSGDIVAVTGDPTRDVTLLERPDAVIKGGRLVKGGTQYAAGAERTDFPRVFARLSGIKTASSGKGKSQPCVA